MAKARNSASDASAPLATLPIDAVLPEVLEAAKASNRIVLEAATGAGKTTRVPPALLSAVPGRILVLEPRRVAARAASVRIAEEQNWKLGNEIGYQIRFDRKWTKASRIVFVTEGVLLRFLQEDPFLSDFDCVVLDEFHERSLQSDTALALLRSLQDSVRNELLLLVMSATFDTERLTRELSAIAIRSEGRAYPVEVSYDNKRDSRRPVERLVAAVLAETRSGTSNKNGSILAFLPGVGEIRRAHDLLTAADCSLPIFDLYGDLPLDQQQEVLRSSKPRVVLATNVAETSVTVEGVRSVVDSGLHRQLRFDASAGFDRLELLPISRASADQRSGRAGRQAAGRSLRLWTESEQSVRLPSDPPEIHRVDFSSMALYLLSMGEDPKSLQWLDPPKPANLRRSLELLRTLGALSESGLVTDVGKPMASLPLHPRLARLVLATAEYDRVEEGALLAALLSERDVFRRSSDGGMRSTGARSDLLDRLDAVQSGGQGAVQSATQDAGNARQSSALARRLDRRQAQRVRQVAKQLLGLLPKDLRTRRRGSGNSTPSSDRREQLSRSLLTAFPDRVALFGTPVDSATGQSANQTVHLSADMPRDRISGRLVSGGGVKLAGSDVHLQPEADTLVLCLELGGAIRRDDRRHTAVHSATVIHRSWLDPDSISVREEVDFDPVTERVVAMRRTYYSLAEQQLLLEEREFQPTGNQVETALLEAAKSNLETVLDTSETKLANLRDRLSFVQRFVPEADLPRLDNAYWQEQLPHLITGRRDFGGLRKAIYDWLPNVLTYEQKQTLDRLAPERLQLPNDRTARVAYPRAPNTDNIQNDSGDAAEPEVPVLAARIQDFFGWQETPTIAGGRVPLILHLLAPNQRPQQITDDLRGFWTGSYELVRKDLAGRYPKHHWPIDPLNAKPSLGTNRRR